jgi:hypothetical protein
MWNETALFLKPLDNPTHDVLTAQQCTDHGLPAKYAGCVAVGGYYTSNNDLFTDTRFTALDTSTYVHFLTSFAMGIGDVECENRFVCICTVSKDNFVQYLPFFRQGYAANDYPMHVYDPIRNGFPRPQKRYTNFKISDGITGSSRFRFNLRCVVDNWRARSYACSAQVYIDPALVSLLSNYTNASYNGYNGEFMIKLYWDCLIMDVIIGQCSYEIYSSSSTGWQQYAFNYTSTSPFSCSRITKIELYQKSSKDGKFYKRKDWPTGNSSDLSFSTSKVNGTGTYYFNSLEYDQSTKDILFD